MAGDEGGEVHDLISFLQPVAQQLLVVAVLAWIGLRINYIRRKVKAADGLACLQCLYCLRGLEPCGKCPECGTPYDISVVAATWPRVLRNAGF